jgi:hypothetical protein
MSKILQGCCFSMILAVTPTAWAGIKCWSNADGVRECGNTVPPEYAQAGHDEKSADGITRRTQTQAKTPEEVVADRLAQAAQAESDQAIASAAKRQLAADKVLLDTFSTEEDIALALAGQLSNIDAQVKVSTSQVVKLNKTLDDLIRQAADLERGAHPVPEDLAQSIAKQRRAIVNEQGFITAKQAEKETIKAKSASALVRFRELQAAK